MSWEDQGRQQHGWFGSGTAPEQASDIDDPASDSLFDLANIAQRIDYAANSLVGHVNRHDRLHYAVNFDGRARDQLKTAVAAWYGASRLSRDSFRSRFLDPYTSDEVVDLLRGAVSGMVEARSHAALNAAGQDLAVAVQKIGLDRWPRYLADADRRAIAVVSDGDVPGVVKVSATDTAVGIGGLIVLGVLGVIIHQGASDKSSPKMTGQPSSPTVLKNSTSEDGKADEGAPPPPTAVLPDDRRKHILDGEIKGKEWSGGHGPGRGVPGKSEFPKDWSDDKVVEAIKDVANDPTSAREPAYDDRTEVTGTREGIDIKVIIGRDGKTIVTGYPTNTPRNPR